MRETGFAILSCFVLAFAIGSPGGASEVTALKILEKSYDPQTQQLIYELWNESDRTITAWRLSLARSDPHGHAQRSILDQDFVDRRPSVEPATRSGPITPGGSVEAEWSLDVGTEDPGLVGLSLKVTAVVFDDLTWEGEPEAAATILQARTARVMEIGKVLAEIESQEEDPLTVESRSAALRQRAQLLRQQGEDAESVAGGRREVAAVVSATRLELAQWLENASREVALSPNPEEAWSYLTGSLRQRYELGLRSTTASGELEVNPPSRRKGGGR